MRLMKTPFVLAILLIIIPALAASGFLPGSANYRGKSLEEWSVVASEWQIASGLGDASDLSDTVKGVRFLPPTIGGGEFEFDITVTAGTPIFLSSFYVFGEQYDDGTADNPADPILPLIFETTDVETILDGQLILEGTTSDMTDRLTGPSVFDEPISYSTPQPRGPALNAVAAIFTLGVGGILPPLPVGTHTLENSIDSLFFGPTHAVYHITVVPNKK